MFLVVRMLLQRKAGFVHVLENFRGAFEEKLAKFRSYDRRAESSRRALDSLIHGRVVLVNHVEFGGKSEQTLGVAHEKIAFRIQAAMEFVDQALLLRLVEIDHDIAAENHVVALRQKFRFQIVKVELNQILQRGLDCIFVADLVEVAKPAGVVHCFHLRFGVDSLLRGEQRGIIDVGSQDFHFPRRRNQRLRRGHLERKRIAQVVVGERIAD